MLETTAADDDATNVKTRIARWCNDPEIHVSNYYLLLQDVIVLKNHKRDFYKKSMMLTYVLTRFDALR